MVEDEAVRLSRREFIKRVIASGAVASAATYVYGGLSGCARPRGPAAGGVERLISINAQWTGPPSVDVLPQETLAMTLRYKLGLDRHQTGLRPG